MYQLKDSQSEHAIDKKLKYSDKGRLRVKERKMTFQENGNKQNRL